MRNDTDDLLEEGELAEVTVDVSGLTTPLGANTEFAMEIKPGQGGVVVVERTTPLSWTRLSTSAKYSEKRGLVKQASP